MSLIKLFFSSKRSLKRKPYIVSSLTIFFTCMMMLLALEMPQKMSAETSPLAIMAFYIFCIIVVGFLFYSTFCLGRKRLRDMGLSAWLVLALFIPYVNWIAQIFLMVYPSKKSDFIEVSK